MRKTLLLFALNTLKQECTRYTFCNEKCPLFDRKENQCSLLICSPSCWDIIEDDDSCDEQLIF